MNCIGIRREDKSLWERRVPLVPADLASLVRDGGVNIRIESSARRAFDDDQFRAAGAEVVDDLGDCPVIMGVKEIPPAKLLPDRTYVYFSHTIKGQPANMPALRRLLELGCNLIDYERIVDDGSRRLVFFGRFAGLAGMIDTLWALGRRLKGEGIDNPFEGIVPAHRYRDIAHAEGDIRAVGAQIHRHGLPDSMVPFVCGFAGYGQVSQGAQQVFDWLPFEVVDPADLSRVARNPNVCYKAVFKEEDMVAPRDASRPFELQEYYGHPERYEAAFFPRVRHLTVMVNCIYWEPKYPRLITREQFRELYGGGARPRLKVIGDITCDVDGSVACTVKATTPDDPIFVYDPQTGTAHPGVSGHGPVVLAVDFLPCELPVDASLAFSQSLRGFIPALASADYSRSVVDSGLPPELRRAAIVFQGELTEPYQYLAKHLQ